MKLLFTNDDGVHADGLQELYRQFSKKLECWISAPATQQSAKSHAFSLGKELVVQRHSSRCVSIEGTPADSVYYGMNGMAGGPFDWVLSGINAGSNLGTDVHYSGTVGAAMEGCFHGAHALAVSLHGVERVANADYTHAAEIALQVFLKLAPLVQQSPPSCWNLNIPNVGPDQMKSVRLAPLARRNYHSAVQIIERVSSSKTVVRLGGAHKDFEGGEHCDGPMLFAGHPTLTQLSWNWSIGQGKPDDFVPSKKVQESLSGMA